MKRIHLLSVLVLSGVAFAQEYPGGGFPSADAQGSEGGFAGGEYSDATPPARGVARISLINGDVSVRRGDSGDVTAAVINAPIVASDTLLTTSSSRAEIQFDSGNVLRVGANSEVRMGDLQVNHFQVQVALGTFTYRILRSDSAQAEIDTPNVALRPLGPGTYRIAVREDGSAEITIRQGEAEIASQAGSERLRAGQTMLVRGGGAGPEFQIAAPVGYDDWDRWNEQRDNELTRSRSNQYVSSDIYGTESLDHYGRWVQDPNYGNVWAPTVDPGWAPYRAGRWVWEDYYGWTWVSEDPWGWAPYHWGRWFQGSVGWCWYPGASRYHHYWSPALVAFFGYGGYSGFNVGVGFGFGGVGWVPLAPYEAFHPWWGGRGWDRGGWGGYRNTVILNNTNIYNSYRNARGYNGVTGVMAGEFGRHSGRFSALGQNEIRNASLVRGMLPVTPDRASLRFSDRAVRSNGLPQSRAANFYSRSGQRGARSVPFEQQRAAVQQIARNTFTPQGVRTPQGVQPFSGGSYGGAAGANGRGAMNVPNGTAQTSSGRGFGSFNGTNSSAGFSGRSVPYAGGAAGGQPGGTYRGAQGSAPYSGVNRGTVSNTGGWGRFGGTNQQQYPASQSRASQGYNRAPQAYSSPRSSSEPVRISPQIVHERPTYSAPSSAAAGNYRGYGGGQYSAPSYSAPRSYGGGNYGGGRSAPSYSAPRSYSGGGQNSAPSYSAPRSYGGGNNGGGRSAPSYSAPRSYSGGSSRANSNGGGSGASSSRGSSREGGGGGHRR